MKKRTIGRMTQCTGWWWAWLGERPAGCGKV